MEGGQRQRDVLPQIRGAGCSGVFLPALPVDASMIASAELDELMPFFRHAGVMEFPQMMLVTVESEKPVLEGRGKIEFPRPDKMIVHLSGEPEDLGFTLEALSRQRGNPYEPLYRFFLRMTDVQGRRWSASCEVETFNDGDNGWTLLGWTQCISMALQLEPHEMGWVESRFLVPREFSMGGALNEVVRRRLPDGSSEPMTILNVLGEPVTLRFDFAAGMLTAAVSISETFPTPMADGWLGEPLRILFGQLVYPRLVLRRLPCGHAQVHLRVSPGWSLDSRAIALWKPDFPASADEFLHLYRGLLTIIATGREFEAHQFTSLFVEVIEASKGTRWVLALTLASSIEGLVKKIGERRIPLSDEEEREVREMLAYLKAWPASDRIKDRIRDVLGRLPDLSIYNDLMRLAKQGVGDKEGADTWKDVRNKVMHGELVSPYSSEDSDRAYLALVRLLHCLTREAARRALPDQS